MKKKTIDNLWRVSNAIRHVMTTEEDGLECLSGYGAVVALGLLIVLIIVFGTLLGGL